MAVVLFVHGVATRDGKDYKQAVEGRDRRFKDVAFGGNADILNPYWGAFGADPAWKLASIPDLNVRHEALGLDGLEPLDLDGLEEDARENIILNAARSDFPAVVAGLSVEDLVSIENAGDENALLKAERFWAAAAEYAERSPKPGWLVTVTDDDQFTAELKRQVAPFQDRQDLGLLDGVRDAGRRIAGAMSNALNKPLARFGREYVSPRVAIFIGDVFRYLKAGQGRPEIRAAVIAGLKDAAKKAQSKQSSLVLIGHSLGGVILYDLISDEDEMKKVEDDLEFPLVINLLLTVGSQVALFEELKVFTASDNVYSGSQPPPRNLVPNSKRIQRWWNAYDRMDVLSFLTQPIFKDALDFEVDTLAGVASAHGGYFYNMLFYQRLNARLREAGLA